MSEQTKTDYKNTLNLPQTTLEMRANATVKEIQTQKFWEENKTFENRIVTKKDEFRIIGQIVGMFRDLK